MNILDIISLAKAGYTPKDVKDLLSIEVEKKIETKEDAPETPDDASDEEIDYKSLYESQIDKIEKLKADNLKISDDLKKAQKINTKTAVANDNDINKNSLDTWEKFLKEGN